MTASDLLSRIVARAGDLVADDARGVEFRNDLFQLETLVAGLEEEAADNRDRATTAVARARVLQDQMAHVQSKHHEETSEATDRVVDES